MSKNGRAGQRCHHRSRHRHNRLGEDDETPAIVIVTWPAKATVFHPRRFRLARIG